MKRRWLPKWVSQYADRHGKARYRFRRTGFKSHEFTNAPGTPAFMEEYKRCTDGIEAPAIRPGADRFKPGTFDDLIARWYASSEFEALRDRTRYVYRNDLERWRTKYGKAYVRDLRPRDVQKAMQERMPRKTSANNLRKRLGQLMRFAVQMELADRNPVLAVKPYEIEGDGHHSWTEPEIEQYETRHPIGTQARLILDIFLYTGQRLGDVRTLGPRHYQDGRLEFYQEKRKGKVFMSIPMLAPLAETILASKTGQFCFIVSSKGTAYTSQSLGNLVKKYCRQAGLPHCSAHGLRKAAARRLALSGATNAEIKSWTGHTTDSEVARYTKGASNVLLSDAAGAKLLANLAIELDKKTTKQLKRKD